MLEIEKPVIQCVESNDNGTYGKFEIEPLESCLLYTSDAADDC